MFREEHCKKYIYEVIKKNLKKYIEAMKYTYGKRGIS